MEYKGRTVTYDVERFEKMSTVEEQSAIPPEEALEMSKEAKLGTWYSDEYTPYCGAPNCRIMPRTIKHDYGYSCPSCGNMIGHDYRRLKESELNFK